jgi:hypothetical protein
MTKRDELEAKLKSQRERRQVAHILAHPVPVKRKNGRLELAALIATLLMLSMAVFEYSEYLSPAMTPAHALVIATSSPIHTHTATSTKAARVMTVCTDIPNGRMNVHFAPGQGSEIRGYLKEKEHVEIVESRDAFGGVWMNLNSPIKGWANGRYLCAAEDQ